MNHRTNESQTESDPDSNQDNGGIEQLLREVGARETPNAQIEQAVRLAVFAEWQSVVAQQANKKRRFAMGIAAGFAVAAIALIFAGKYVSVTDAVPVSVATVVKMEGNIQAGAVQLSGDRGATWRDISLSDKLTQGSTLRTDSTTAVALEFSNKLSIRLGPNSIVKLNAVDGASLERGRLYIDAAVGAHVPFVIQTRFGEVEHLGTQYQVQISADRVVAGVREGRIAMTNRVSTVQAVAGEAVEFGEQGELARHALAAQDPSWNWVEQVAPTFDIENRTLHSFLDWVAHETGRTIRYSDAKAREEAEKLILKGSVGSLNPEQALTAVLATTRFTHQAHADVIEIGLSP